MDRYSNLYKGVERDDVQYEITKLALNYHLVSKFTSLVAVDISPTRPAGEELVSKPVVKKIKAPQTATNSTLWMIVGLILMFVAFVFRRRQAM